MRKDTRDVGSVARVLRDTPSREDPGGFSATSGKS